MSEQNKIETRFWSKVFKAEDCWYWTAYKNEDGYGYIGLNGKLIRAHRLAWTLTRGDIPKGLFVLHVCDNPPCVNPDHLYLGTNQDNVRDAARKGHMSRYGMTNSSCKLQDSQVLELVNAFRNGSKASALMKKYQISDTHFYNLASGQRRQILLREKLK